MIMKSIDKIFSDKEGNHLLVALCFCDDDYKQNSLHIPEEYAEINIVDINITKAYVEKPIHFSVFFNMSSWLLHEFEMQDDAVFTFICSTDELTINHPDFLPQEFRWELFDRLYKRRINAEGINVQDVIVGPEGYQSLGRAFYREKHSSIINIIVSYLRDKQQLY